jgi:hypothetical protein
MRTRSRRLTPATLAATILAGVLSLAPPPAGGATCQSWDPTSSPGNGQDVLDDVAAPSACNAWAVGYSDANPSSRFAEIIHFDGESWDLQAVPLPADETELLGVDAASDTAAWAVGDISRPTRPLVERWSGTAWRRPALPAVPNGSFLIGVSARTATDVWAVGRKHSGGVDRTFAMHWNGTAWKVVATPNPSSGDNQLNAVVAIGPNDVWAAGNGQSPSKLLLHWDGTAWKQFDTPSPGPGEYAGLAATASNDVWVVGDYFDATLALQHPLIKHWNGTAWRGATLPDVPGDIFMNDISAASPGSVWAVGTHGVILHWAGASWTQQPADGTDPTLSGVAAVSPDSAWAVGDRSDGGTGVEMAILHCC